MIHDGILFPLTGTIAASDGRLIFESTKGGGLRGATPTFDRVRWPRPRSIGDRLVTTIEIGSYQTSYGHWILDALPRLWALSKLDESVELYVPQEPRQAQRQLLEWAKPDNVTILETDDPTPLTSRRVLLTPYLSTDGCGLMRPEALAFFRDRIVAGARRVSDPTKARPRALYVSRAKTTHSRVANEPALEAALAKQGIVSMLLEDLPIAEQVMLFANAELVVGALSSGLTNCVFQSRGARRRIFAGGEGPTSHTPSLTEAGICMVSGLRYEPVYHSHVSPEPAFTVDVDAVLAAIARARA
ncbi:MAG: glycosyltransferase family 61 protein [Archangiaceae bacterium]|nr:glycosyltransferase family 61 protein [Archangiaceae bacterium]